MNQSIENSVEAGSSVISRDERKKLRRERVMNKSKAETSDLRNSASAERVPPATSNGPLHALYSHGQINDSNNLIESMKSKALLTVTQLRIEAEQRENLRIQSKFQESLTSFEADENNGEISDLLVTSPKGAEELGTCHERLDKILVQRENQMVELQRTLRSREEKYVNEIKQQRSDIEALRELIRAETGEMTELYVTERDRIESALLHDRDDIIGKHRKDINMLFDKKGKREVESSEARKKREVEYEIKLNALREEKRLEYIKLKANFDADIEQLEHELGKLNSTNRVSCDKIDYELQAMFDKDKGNLDVSQKYKRKVAKGEEILNLIKEEYRQFHESKKKQICVDLNDVSRAAKRLKELQAKVKHLTQVERQKYDAIWEMHREVVNFAREDVLSKHRTITTEILGW